MTHRIHVAAAAKELNRVLFNDTTLAGRVAVGEDNLEVVVHGRWEKTKLDTYAGYDVAWRELPLAA